MPYQLDFDPVLRSKLMSGCIGPSLPPGFAPQEGDGGGKNEEVPPLTIGPLPLTNTSDSATSEVFPRTIGPCMPSQSTTPPESSPPSEDDVSRSYGPMLPPGLGVEPPSPDDLPAIATQCSPTYSESEESEEEEEEVIGPMPAAGRSKVTEDLQRKKAIEARAQAMKDKLTGKDLAEAGAPKREEWMTVLPVEFKPLGIGARKFRAKPPEGGDRSGWTDTPTDKRRKAQEARSGKKVKSVEKGRGKGKKEYACVMEKDQRLTQQVEQHNKEHRSLSLMEVHRKRRAEAQGGDDEERRPFDRDVDLAAPRNLVTPNKRMAMMKDSQQSLGNRFHHGSRSFL